MWQRASLRRHRRPGSERRVNRLVGYGSAAAAVLIMFLPVGTVPSFGGDGQGKVQVSCGPGWHALFSGVGPVDFGCGGAAQPHLWIAAAIAAAGIGWTQRAAGRGWIVGAVAWILFLTLLIDLAAWAVAPRGGE